ncbi:MAG: cation diffusion facilitator family transporter [Candidatus Muiribacteriaceae bacterium]
MKEECKTITDITVLSVFVNIFLSVIKVIGGITGKSSALTADGIHSLSDLISDSMILFGARLWTRPGDSDHPYGHRRVENLVTAIIGLLLSLTAAGIFYRSVKAIYASDTLSRPCSYTIAIAFLSIILKESLYFFTLRTGKRINSGALIANAWHHRTDSFSSIPVLASVGIAYFFDGYQFVDHVGAIIVSGILFKVGGDFIVSSMNKLLDRSACDKTLSDISELSYQIPDVKEVHAIRTRFLGDYIALDMHVLVDSSLSIKEAHAISGKVKHHLHKNLPKLQDIIIHIEPYPQTDSSSVPE